MAMLSIEISDGLMVQRRRAYLVDNKLQSLSELIQATHT